jgi:hypothetical protein
MDIITIAEKLQKECHSFTNDLKKNIDSLKTQDATNVWLFKKLAEFELRLSALEESKRSN